MGSYSTLTLCKLSACWVWLFGGICNSKTGGFVAVTMLCCLLRMGALQCEVLVLFFCTRETRFKVHTQPRVVHTQNTCISRSHLYLFAKHATQVRQCVPRLLEETEPFRGLRLLRRKLLLLLRLRSQLRHQLSRQEGDKKKSTSKPRGRAPATIRHRTTGICM